MGSESIEKQSTLTPLQHIKPWAESSPTERLDLYNGLLLSPDVDACFDTGYVSFDDEGSVLISKRLVPSDAEALGIHSRMRLRQIEPKHRVYLAFHREHVFKHSARPPIARKEAGHCGRQPVAVEIANGHPRQLNPEPEASMRVEQGTGTKGSLKWIQRLVSQHPELIGQPLRATGALGPDDIVEWVSPREADGWAEYRDAGFLDQLQLGHLRGDLRAFWPSNGPQWDALGRTTEGTVILVEAKAHLGELASRCQAIAPESRARIEAAFNATRRALGAQGDSEWMTGYYQYANRLAHLYFLLTHGVDAQLVFVYFVGDEEMPGPNARGDFEREIAGVRRSLGLSEGRENAHVTDIYIDVAALR